MSVNPYQAGRQVAGHPGSAAAGRMRRFGLAHLGIFLILWTAFTLLTFFAVSRGLDDAPGKPSAVALTTALASLGPLTGAISRGLQGCCLAVSLSLIPYCAPPLLLAIFVQFALRPANWRRQAIRLSFWTLGWFAWFAGGLVALGHALS